MTRGVQATLTGAIVAAVLAFAAFGFAIWSSAHQARWALSGGLLLFGAVCLVVVSAVLAVWDKEVHRS